MYRGRCRRWRPGLVDAGHRADDVREVPAAVRTLIAQVGGDGESGLADDSRAILPETHGVVAAVAAEDLSSDTRMPMGRPLEVLKKSPLMPATTR